LSKLLSSVAAALEVRAGRALPVSPSALVSALLGASVDTLGA
jgi:hypothetical protein